MTAVNSFINSQKRDLYLNLGNRYYSKLNQWLILELNTINRKSLCIRHLCGNLFPIPEAMLI